MAFRVLGQSFALISKSDSGTVFLLHRPVGSTIFYSMTSPSSRPSWTALFAWTTVAWFALSAIMAVEAVSSNPYRLRTWLQAWIETVPRWIPGLSLTLVVFAVVREFPLRGRRPVRNMAVHGLTAVSLTALGLALQQGFLRALRPAYASRVSFLEGYQSVFRQMGALCLMLYAGLVGLYDTFERAHRSDPGSPSEELPPQDAAPPTNSRADDRFLVRTGDALVPVHVDEIEWIEAADSYVRLHLTNGDTHLHRSSMTAMTDRLGDRPFLRVHRSTIVRIDAIKRVETPSAAGHYEVVLRDDTRRRVSNRYREALLDAIGSVS